jgi:MFS transporter, ACDE family, multidrug resistance protein
VWAVGLAAIVSFMGLGLVDPILPAIAHELRLAERRRAAIHQLLRIHGLSMLFSSVVASRIGSKRTLLAGLVLIIIFSALAGASNSVGAIVGLRAGWGFARRRAACGVGGGKIPLD